MEIIRKYKEMLNSFFFSWSMVEWEVTDWAILGRSLCMKIRV